MSQNLFTRLSLAVVFSTLILTGSSCKKNSGDSNSDIPAGHKQLKFTMTTSATTGYYSGAFVGLHGHFTTNEYDVWKVNGVVIRNQPQQSFDWTHFRGGKTIIVESAKPVWGANLGFTCYRLSTEPPFTFSLKVEQNGKVVFNESKLITEAGESWKMEFTY